MWRPRRDHRCITNRSIPGRNNVLCFSPALIATGDDIDAITNAVDNRPDQASLANGSLVWLKHFTEGRLANDRSAPYSTSVHARHCF